MYVTVLATLLFSCGSNTEGTAIKMVSCPAEPAAVASPAPPAYDAEQAARQGCVFTKGSTVEETVGVPPTIPLKHIVVLMMENRSFDHYLSGLDSVDTTRANANPDPSAHGASVPQYHETNVCPDGPNHEWGPTHLQYDHGSLDGFVAATNPGGSRAMGYYDETDIPFYYWLARHYAISDRHFASLLGPTWPNRLFLLAATSCGFAEGFDTNPDIAFSCGATADNLFRQLRRVGASYEIYSDGAVPLISSLYFDLLAEGDPNEISDFATFQAKAAANTLPDVAIVEPDYEAETHIVGGAPNDDHPPANIELGQQFVYDVLSAIASDPDTWRSTAVFITYDEHGGYYDHVVPPPACDPAGTNAGQADYGFNRYGFRVPLFVVSPYTPSQGYVSHYVTDHTSILRFIQAWKGLGALTQRDANAWPMFDMFDFSKTPDPPPSLTGMRPSIDEARNAGCPEK